MLFQSTLLAAFALASSVRAQSSPTAYVESTVPTGKPIAGNYGGALRPQIHFSPPKNFMVSCAAVSRPVYGFNTFGGVASSCTERKSVEEYQCKFDRINFIMGLSTDADILDS